jgi:DNA replication protein DnaC
LNTVDVSCVDCGLDFVIELPEGTSVGYRWVSALANREPRCEVCFDKHEAEEAERERKSAREARRGRCQLPNRLRGELLPNFRPKPGQQAAVAAAGEWANSKDAGGLMLTGETGVGKTRIAAAACWTRLEHFPCTYASVARAMAKLGGSFTDEGRAEAVRMFSGNGAVILDDLDKTRPTDFGLEQLFAAVDAREQAGAPLLVTTNLTPSEIGERYGDPLMSRLVGYCRSVRVEGDDWRVTR